MKRKIIHIDEEKCNGCGACAKACHEGAIGIVDGKAKLLRDDYCDGLGDCLPSCPMSAITFVEREAAPYDEQAVIENKQKNAVFQCPGMMARTIRNDKEAETVPGIRSDKKVETARKVRNDDNVVTVQNIRSDREAEAVQGIQDDNGGEKASQLRQWPVQIKLAPTNAPYFNGADLLVAADCTAYAYGNFHEKFIKGRITLIGCPKLDAIDYSEKLTEIFRNNDIKSITVTRMEVPCCGGLEFAVKKAIENSGKNIPLDVVTISTEGRILG